MSRYHELASELAMIDCHVPEHVIAGWSKPERSLASVWAADIANGETDPAVRPAFLEPWDCRRCRRCGCTDAHGCGAGCEWVEEDLCSLCKSPASVRELLEFLRRRRRVICRNLDGKLHAETFRGSEDDGLWFDRSGRASFLPIGCRKGAAGASEGGLKFGPDGFTFTKFGMTVYYTYQRGPNA